MLTDCTNAAVVKRKRKKKRGKKKKEKTGSLCRKSEETERGGAEWRVKLDKERLPL